MCGNSRSWHDENKKQKSILAPKLFNWDGFDNTEDRKLANLTVFFKSIIQSFEVVHCES